MSATRRFLGDVPYEAAPVTWVLGGVGSGKSVYARRLAIESRDALYLDVQLNRTSRDLKERGVQVVHGTRRFHELLLSKNWDVVAIDGVHALPRSERCKLIEIAMGGARYSWNRLVIASSTRIRELESMTPDADFVHTHYDRRCPEASHVTEGRTLRCATSSPEVY